MPDFKTMNRSVIEEFRANDGKVAQFGGLPIVILHTIGAKSGELRETPLIPVFNGDQMLVFATAAGSPTHPAWYHNLVAHPQITVEYEGDRFTADLVQLSEQDAGEITADMAERTPQLADYVASAAPRKIPVFRVDRVS